MFALLRFRVDDPQADPGPGLEALTAALAARPGAVDVRLGRALDAPELWSVVARFADLGTFRRALSAYEVKVAFGPVQHWMLDEPAVYGAVSDPVSDAVSDAVAETDARSEEPAE